MIFESGKKWGVASHIIADAIKDKISHDDFREQALKNKLKEVKSTASAKYVPQFSLKNYILAKANGEKLERTEQMVVDSAREDFGKSKVGGTFLPNICFNAPPTRAQRDLLASVPSAGGYTIADELLPLVEPLTPDAPLLGLVTNVNADSQFQIPRQKTKATATWTDEIGRAIETNIEWDVEAISPRYLRSLSSYSKDLLNQSSTGVEALLRADMRTAINIGLESAILNLSNPAKGILHNPAVTTLVHGRGVIAYDTILQAESAVLSANVAVASQGKPDV